MATKKKTGEKSAKAEKAEKAEKPKKAEKPEKAEKVTKAKAEKPAKAPAKKAAAKPKKGKEPEPEVDDAAEAESDEGEEEEESAAPAEPAAPVVAAPPPVVVAAPVMPAPIPVVPAEAPRRAPVFVPPTFAVAPPPAPVREPHPVKPTWKTRQVPPEEMPSSRADAEAQLTNAARAHDGSIIGLEKKKLSEARLMRVGADGVAVPLSEPGQFSQFSLSTDGKRIYGVRATGKIVTFAVERDAVGAIPCFEAGSRIWDFKILNGQRAVLSQDRAIHVISTEGAIWKRLDSVSVAPVDIPLVDAVDGGNWVVVGRTPKIRLFAVVNDKLLEVQSWAPTEGGVTAVAGRAFLYAPGSVVREEILNLAEVHQTLS